MAVLPTRLFQWATSVLGLSRRIPPVTGLADDGYATNAVPTSGNLNDMLGLIGEWVNFVYQSFTVSAEFAGPMTVDDAVQLNAGLEVNGGNLVLGSAGDYKHAMQKTQTVIGPFTYTSAAFDMSSEILIASAAGRAKYGFAVDGGMRILMVAALVRCTSGTVNVEVNATVTDNNAARLTESANANVTGGGWQWIQVDVSAATGWPNPIAPDGTSSLVADVTYAGANVQVAKVVMYYDRPL